MGRDGTPSPLLPSWFPYLAGGGVGKRGIALHLVGKDSLPWGTLCVPFHCQYFQITEWSTVIMTFFPHRGTVFSLFTKANAQMFNLLTGSQELMTESC